MVVNVKDNRKAFDTISSEEAVERCCGNYYIYNIVKQMHLIKKYLFVVRGASLLVFPKIMVCYSLGVLNNNNAKN